MIIIDITGDLGSQLFQYATARSLAIDKNTEIFLNLDYFSDESLNKNEHFYQLNHFNINNNQINTEKIKNLNDIHTITETSPQNKYAEYMNLNKNFKNIYLKGKWQNEKYFKHNRSIIKEDLKINTPLSSKNQKIQDEITVSNSVCISLRDLKEFNSYSLTFEGQCSEDYYIKSINLITKIVKNPTFFIFTNDKTLVEDYIKLDYPIVPIEFNKKEQKYEDLQLMSACENFILTNDNINWWSAWLSNNKNKTIIAPTPWFSSFTNQNILCPKWIHIKSTQQENFNKSNK